MKKIIFSLFAMVFLMSFTTKSTTLAEDSPECFADADAHIASTNLVREWLGQGPLGYAEEYSLWLYYYDQCEAENDHDEFQFPG